MKNTNLGIGHFLDYEAVAKILDISPATVRSQVSKGKLKSIHVGKFRLIPMSEIERYKKERKPGAPFRNVNWKGKENK